MQMREFRRVDWDGFAGAERWPGGALPLIGTGTLKSGMEYVLILDANGGCLILDDEQAAYGGYHRPEPFLSQAEAHSFARKLGTPKHWIDLVIAGFTKV
jgi:hypothetical protein